VAQTHYDLVINGVKARIAQNEEGGGYKRRSVRREIQNQIIAQSENPSSRNREDGVAFYQKSWAGGSRWWKPLITPQDLSSYFQSNHMDTWSEPGKIVPGNKHTDTANTDIHDMCVMATNGTDIYAIGDNNTTDAAERSVYKWTPASNAFVRETTYSSGIQDDSIPVAMVYDSSDGYFYVLAETAAGGREIGRFNPTTPAHDLSWYAASGALKYGSNIITTPYGIFFTAGGAVFEVNKTGPAADSRFDPGNTEILAYSTTNIVGHSPLLISTPQGMYLIRNTLDAGQPVASIYRIDRDVSGVFVGNPIAVLPRGSYALSVQFHLGQLLVATTPDWRDMQDGTQNVEVAIYFVGEGGMGALGSMLGGRDEQDETPYNFIGAEGEKVYIGGQKRLWVYDAIRGGLHSAWNWETAQTAGGYRAMARAQDSAGDEIMLFLAKDRINTVKVGDVNNPETVTDFGDDLTHYTLESNTFDGGLPMEIKEITEVSILRDKDDGGSQWLVQISADDGAFATLLSSAGTTVHDSAVVSGTKGYQFRYKVIYQTKDTARSALRALMIGMTTGDMVTEWDVMLDGSELLNMDNERQDPADFADSMVTLGANADIITLVDNYNHQRDVATDSAGTKVKVVAVEVMKDVPGESRVRVLLREA
jgi:hypothetical protein